MQRIERFSRIVVFSMLIATATAEMPASFNVAMSEMDNVNILCVKNYESGVVFTEAYTNFEHLDKDTIVVTRNFLADSQFGANQSALDAAIDSSVIGQAHLAWKSFNPGLDARGQHTLLGSNAEDLTGVFSINKLIQLWSNSSIKGSGIDWIPCV